MTNPFLVKARHQTRPLADHVLLSPDYDDDDDADDDDADDEIHPGTWRRQSWLSRADFGSPEWWSRG